MKIETQGRAKLATMLKESARSVQSNVDRARKECAEDFLATAMPGVPLSIRRRPSDPNPGELRRSGYVDHTLVRDSSIVGFSDSKAPFVHEMGEDKPDDNPEDDPDGRINWSTPGTGAKFLEAPFVALKPLYRRRIIDAARKGIS